MLAVTAIAAIRIRNLFAVAMLSGIYSLLTAVFFVVMDAVDVAFTEAAVGAGVATVFMLGALALTTRLERQSQHTRRFWLPVVVVVIVGAALVYGAKDIPPFGSASNPVHQHVAPRYIKDSLEEIDIPNMVTSVLASYRGYDTFGETVVVFTAGIGVLMLLGVSGRDDDNDDDDQQEPLP